MTKQELRKAYLQKRMDLPETEYLRLNRLLCELFFSSVDLSAIHTLHTFLPILKNKEPDTRLIVERVRKEFPHVRLSVPRVDIESGQLENFYYEGTDQLHENKWGIPEPRHGVHTPIGNIDMVLVPLLIFDETGHRVGYGKGHYDRFLTACRKDCTTIGICFFPPVTGISTMEAHDRKLSAVVTPSKYFQF